MNQISSADFTFLIELSEKWMGSVFKEDKKYLFENRLQTMVKSFNYAGMSELINDLKNKGDMIGQEKKNFFIDLITTHETLFFRDKSPFKNIKEVILPEFHAKSPGGTAFNIYSAACSTGQEVVSLAIQMNESLPPGHPFHILGTDISPAVIAYAKAGRYSQYEVQRGLPTRLLTKFFRQDGEHWIFKDEYRKNLQFEIENLLKPKPKFKMFHLVLCRNVTIYMDPPKVRQLYERVHACMHAGAYLIIGHSERMTDHSDLFRYQRTEAGIIYQKV